MSQCSSHDALIPLPKKRSPLCRSEQSAELEQAEVSLMYHQFLLTFLYQGDVRSDWKNVAPPVIPATTPTAILIGPPITPTAVATTATPTEAVTPWATREVPVAKSLYCCG